jgi:anthranilate synthase component 1
LAVPTVRSFSAEFEPLRLVAQFPDVYPGLLESSAPIVTLASGGRYDILPICSGERLCASSRDGLSGPYCESGEFLTALDSWWRALQLPSEASSLPFTGGWLLYLGYELAAEVEPCLTLPTSSDPFVALALRAPAAWIRDRLRNEAWLVAESGAECLLDAFEAHVAQVSGAVSPAEPAMAFDVQEEPPGKFLHAVQAALEYIAAGDIYQANLSRQWQAVTRTSLDSIAIYRALRSTNPSPFAAMLRHGDFSLMSSSPERLVSVRDGLVATRPIAGTRPRGATPEDDAALIQSLLQNEKERAEHVMLIDLERNDLGRVCEGGSVEVDEYMAVETYKHVHHIVSNVRGRLRTDLSPVQVIRALFPGGTITGCPKVRCMQIIAELEATARGSYTGSIGYLNRDGSCDLNILIRTLSAVSGGRRPTVTFRAGAGIVADSVPAQELAETRAKAEGMLRALRRDAPVRAAFS